MYMTKTIVSNLLSKYSTRLHPFEQRILPDGFRGRLKFIAEKCILCRLCEKKCPTNVIHIDTEVGLWEREVMRCLYCGVCEDVCPTDCITMTNVHRPPITEAVLQRFNVTPKPSKKKEQQPAKAVEMADDQTAKVETVEETATANVESAAAKKKTK